MYAHDVITLDGTPPPKFRALARADLLNYPTVNYTVAKITTIQNVNNGTMFIATDTNGQTYSARKVMLATGSRDILPDFPGMDVIWGTGAFWCLYFPRRSELILDGAMAGNTETLLSVYWDSIYLTTQSPGHCCTTTSPSTRTGQQSKKLVHGPRILHSLMSLR